MPAPALPRFFLVSPFSGRGITRGVMHNQSTTQISHRDAMNRFRCCGSARNVLRLVWQRGPLSSEAIAAETGLPASLLTAILIQGQATGILRVNSKNRLCIGWRGEAILSDTPVEFSPRK